MVGSAYMLGSLDLVISVEGPATAALLDIGWDQQGATASGVMGIAHLSQAFFADGFELGDTSGWSAVVALSGAGSVHQEKYRTPAGRLAAAPEPE